MRVIEGFAESGSKKLEEKFADRRCVTHHHE